MFKKFLQVANKSNLMVTVVANGYDETEFKQLKL